MKHLSKTLVMILFLTSIASINTGCSWIFGPPKIVKSPLKTDVRRGATRVDVYGWWTTDYSLLGTPNGRFFYQVRYVPAGTKVYALGTTNGTQLYPWDGLPVTWNHSGDVFSWGSPDYRTDTAGKAGYTLGASALGGGSLTVAVHFPPEIPGGLRQTVTENTVFETDPAKPTVRR